MNTKNFDGHYDYLILGAGFAGLAAAYFLLREGAGSVCVLEKEKAACLAASGRNASMICQLVRDPLVSRIMAESSELLHSDWLREFPEVEFNRCGSLHIGSEKDLVLFETSARDIRHIAPTRFMTRQEAVNAFPYLKHTEFERAVHCPTDGIVDIRALTAALTGRIKARGGAFRFLSEGLEVRATDEGFEIKTQDAVHQGKTLVNAAGAWAGEIAAKAGALPITVQPTRRHMAVTAELDDDITGRPIVWDVTHEVYFRPEGRALMLSACDEENYPAGPTPVDAKAEGQLRKKLKTFLPEISETEFVRQWSGLRTFSADRRFVLGDDARLKNFFWLACLGGYGLTSSARLGQLAAGLLTGQTIPEDYRAALSPARFSGEPLTCGTPDALSKERRPLN